MRRVGVCLAAAAVCLLVTAAPAGASSDTTVLLIDFENAESLAPGTVVVDSSGFGHNGTVRGLNGGAPQPVAGEGPGTAAKFPGRCEVAGCPRTLVEVPDDAQLNPGLRPFRYGASIRLQPYQTSVGANVVQKGRYGDPDGQWKLQVDGLSGRPSCVISGPRDGSYQRAIVKSPRSIADGDWHGVACARSADAVELTVDGIVVGRQAFAAVQLSSGAPVTIGSKTVNRLDNDQFHGALDDIYLSVS